MGSVDVYSNNRSKINTDRIKKIDDKVIVFAETIPTIGEGFFEFPFPFKGKVTHAQSTCKFASDAKMQLKVQKCKAALYGTEQERWEDVLTDYVEIEAGKRSSAVQNLVDPMHGEVESGDYFRTLINTIGVGMQNLVTQVVIEIETI